MTALLTPHMASEGRRRESRRGGGEARRARGARTGAVLLPEAEQQHVVLPANCDSSGACRKEGVAGAGAASEGARAWAHTHKHGGPGCITSRGCSSATTVATRSTRHSSRSAAASSASGGSSVHCDSSSLGRGEKRLGLLLPDPEPLADLCDQAHNSESTPFRQSFREPLLAHHRSCRGRRASLCA